MKTVLVIFALVAVVVSRPEGETYSSQYDNFNGKELVENVRLLKNYGKCFLGKGPCTPEGTEFLKVMPEAIRTTCAKCSPKQQELIRIVIKALQEKLPELWAELVKKHDPEGTYSKSFNEFINAN